ncbi:MAG TPA: A/G-specific adenine glycosylase [Candidatus Acidoferrales bacterium]|nr:A/G-specific adenine glycosylase [Candidatus Acidoferrales bacterium]
MPLRGKDPAKFRRRLLEWFGQQQRDLPWRRTKDPYRIWISEIMLQQTRVAAVIPYYEKFLARFPGVGALAAAPEEEVLRQWSGLGYYSRARNLQRAAREIVAKYGGKFPPRYEEALALPGIGSYTAAAILSIAFGRPHAVLDGNVARVLARIEAVRGDLREPHRWRRLQALADELQDRRRPGEWNQAMMELGATLCTPRAPMCRLCPVSSWCRARALGIEETLPEKRKKPDAVRLKLAAAVFLDEKRRTLLLPPPRKNERGAELAALFSRLWHFPAVRVRGDARAELRTDLGTRLGKAATARLRFVPLKAVRQAVTYRDIEIAPFLVRVRALPRARGAHAIPLDGPISVPVSNLTRKIALAAVAQGA